MYIPPYFKIEDPEAIERVVRENGLATLITASSEGLKVSHLPLLYAPSDSAAGNGFITGHMSRGNDHWTALDGESESLAIFHGPDAYVSPEWYEEGPAAPTWNFAVVHMRGPARAIDESDWLSEHVDKLTEHHEMKTLGHSTPTDRDYKVGRLGGIVGVQMKVASVEAKFKLNQNRSAADRLAVADHLDAIGDQAAEDVAGLMRRHGGA
ncbi:MAG: FMN-binding negative transcriptional regulator [Dehalococcoidia bacterium]|jgi:transcriptional regulator|nr:FMN-binding negative transcriptional regulator [Dehalococcoidia bacterium]